MTKLAIAISFSLLAIFVATRLRADTKARSFEFTYGFSVAPSDQREKLRIWIPIPPFNEHQQVEVLGKSLGKSVQKTKDEKYGNRIAYFEVMSSGNHAAFHIKYLILRSEVRALDSQNDAIRILSATERRLYLGPNCNVPITGKPLELLPKLLSSVDTVSKARKIYDKVDSHVRYEKSKLGHGKGDVLWVCDSRFGNCTDFHSLFISLTRSQSIPSTFEIGFPIPQERGEGKIGGYHCWASFFDKSNGWIPVDISEANKPPEMKEYYFGNVTENQISFNQGLDIDLAPMQSGSALNYFVYPHIESNDKVVGNDRITLQFSFKDRP